MKFAIITCIFWLSQCTLAIGQNTILQKQAKKVSRFEFQTFNGGVMLVKARFDDLKDTLNFILDTGSGGISLDSSTCVEFGIKTQATDTFVSGVGGRKKVAYVFNKSLHFPSLTIPKLNFHVNDYDLLSSVYGVKIDGIIGYAFFSKFIVKINFDSSFIEVFEPGEIKYPRGGHTLRPLFTALPIQWAGLRERKDFDFNYYLDSGAGMYLLLSERFVSDSNILLRRRKPVITQAEGIGGKSKMKLTIIKEFKLGPYKFRNVPTYIYDDNNNVTNYPFIGGLIGNDLLRRFNMIYNYPKREIHLHPNKSYLEEFDYAYTGLGIYQVDSQITVDDIVPGSPADKAGFKIDDVLISVNGNISNNIQLYKDIMQHAGQINNILVLRGGKAKLIVMYTGSIK